MRSITKRLVSYEYRASPGADTKGRAAFRVCEKLRGPLSTLTGVIGFHSLLSRALTLAKAEAPWLAGIKLRADGTFEFSPELERQLDEDEAAHGGEALITHLIGLLITFIGEALTLRLVQNIWPKTALKDSEFGEHK